MDDAVRAAVVTRVLPALGAERCGRLLRALEGDDRRLLQGRTYELDFTRCRSWDHRGPLADVCPLSGACAGVFADLDAGRVANGRDGDVVLTAVMRACDHDPDGGRVWVCGRTPSMVFLNWFDST